MTRTVTETAVTFGRFGGLFGVVSETMGGSGDSETRALPAVIFLNTGIIHRVGPGRLSTVWARRLAAAGHCVLRFDLSGVGDSERRIDHLPPIEAAQADLRDAVDWLTAARKVPAVILVGLCSGADLSLLYAGTDDRIVAMIIIDASTPPTWRHHLRKCLTIRFWKRGLHSMLGRLQSARRGQNPSIPRETSDFEPLRPSRLRVREMLANGYRSAFERKVPVLAIFTGGAAWYNYRNQLFDAFPEIDFRGGLRLEYLERCDHTITHEANRARLFELADEWLERVEFKSPIAALDDSRKTSQPPVADGSHRTSVEF